MKTYFMQLVVLFNAARTSAILAEPEWTEWENVSECSAECSVGQLEQERSRTIDARTEVESRLDICYGKKYCARWSEWQNAPTPCSATCGSGKQSRVRNCDNGSVGAVGCQGDVQDFIECNSNPCPFWSEWQVDYNGGNECGQFCKQTKTRECTNAELYAESDNLCSGPALLEIGCSPCGSWTGWEIDSPCSITCGLGKVVHARQCETADNHLSDDCPGTSSKVETCEMDECITEDDPGTNHTADSDIDSKVLTAEELLKAFDELIGNNSNIEENVEDDDAGSPPLDSEFNSMLVDLIDKLETSPDDQNHTIEHINANSTDLSDLLTDVEINGILNEIAPSPRVPQSSTTVERIEEDIIDDVIKSIEQSTVNSTVLSVLPTDTTTIIAVVDNISLSEAVSPKSETMNQPALNQKISSNPTPVDISTNTNVSVPETTIESATVKPIETTSVSDLIETTVEETTETTLTTSTSSTTNTTRSMEASHTPLINATVSTIKSTIRSSSAASCYSSTIFFTAFLLMLL